MMTTAPSEIAHGYVNKFGKQTTEPTPIGNSDDAILIVPSVMNSTMLMKGFTKSNLPNPDPREA
jgi:hypothetical protein